MLDAHPRAAPVIRLTRLTPGASGPSWIGRSVVRRFGPFWRVATEWIPDPGRRFRGGTTVASSFFSIHVRHPRLVSTACGCSRSGGSWPFDQSHGGGEDDPAEIQFLSIWRDTRWWRRGMSCSYGWSTKLDAQGLKTVASRALALPQGPGGPFPVVSYQHGTSLEREDVPSRLNTEGF